MTDSKGGEAQAALSKIEALAARALKTSQANAKAIHQQSKDLETLRTRWFDEIDAMIGKLQAMTVVIQEAEVASQNIRGCSGAAIEAYDASIMAQKASAGYGDHLLKLSAQLQSINEWLAALLEVQAESAPRAAEEWLDEGRANGD